MRTDVAGFFAALHERHLKAMGFRKSRLRFQRARDGYVEHVRFQGSAWSSRAEPWTFYVNVGIELPDPPRRSRGWGALHAQGRIEGLLPSVPASFDLDAGSADALLELLPRLVEEATARLSEMVPLVRERAKRGLLSSLPVREP